MGEAASPLETMLVTTEERRIIELVREAPFLDSKLIEIFARNPQPAIDLSLLVNVLVERGGKGTMELNGPRGGPVHSEATMALCAALVKSSVVPFPDPPPEKPRKR